MPFCPKCRYEYVEGVAVCPDCDVPLERVLPPEETPKSSSGDEPTPLMVAQDVIEADIIKTILGSAGIPVLVQSDTMHIYRATLLHERPIVVLVPASKRAEAEDVLKQASEGGKEIDWDVWRNREFNREDEGREQQ
ncbi:MAG: DUF2007 domain-containing protein [Armatimonadota bacterium]|nr:DUF2007 domain-containing protein [Armatimonadota bacterium]